MFRNGSVVGLLLVLVGGLIMYSGSLGLLYKVIADAVARGNMVAGNSEFELANIEDSLENIEELLEDNKDEEE